MEIFGLRFKTFFPVRNRRQRLKQAPPCKPIPGRCAGRVADLVLASIAITARIPTLCSKSPTPVPLASLHHNNHLTLNTLQPYLHCLRQTPKHRQHHSTSTAFARSIQRTAAKRHIFGGSCPLWHTCHPTHTGRACLKVWLNFIVPSAIPWPASARP